MILYFFGFAPMVFRAMPAEEAGRFIRAAFPWYYLFVIFTAGLAGVILLLWSSWSGVVSIAIAAVAILARQALMPRINSARDAWMAGNADAKRLFGNLRGISVALNFAQLFAAGYVLYRFL